MLCVGLQQEPNDERTRDASPKTTAVFGGLEKMPELSGPGSFVETPGGLAARSGQLSPLHRFTNTVTGPSRVNGGAKVRH